MLQKAPKRIRRNCFKLLDVPFTRSTTLFVRVAAPVLMVGLALLMSGCGKKKHVRVAATPAPSHARRAPAPAVALGYSEEGIASWYGIPYHGRPAADGEIYDMETLVAAHRTLPFNTWLRVTNLANGKSVVLRVIDRGPFVDGRIIDLSKAAARQIDLLGPGIGRVRLEVVAAPADVPLNDFFAVQVGAFSVKASAEKLRDEYTRQYGAAQIEEKQGAVPVWRVLVGKESSFAAAQQLANALAVKDPNVFVVRLDETRQPVSPVVSDTPSVPVSETPND